ncbi:head-tail connector protein [Sphingobium yanoikuyae]|uniref:Phage gp6-like head-tail connector protein n=1 Tax=Sphingobium yanoikuyae TaxID=13690 RepID=A0A3G2UWH4_SPHYA|nr:head-tail connector protein [Sphingobium yanoikuyae]AYO78322.1 phage gp6-like head-tail connector protein [Sphingobium yanoikuyae]
MILALSSTSRPQGYGDALISLQAAQLHLRVDPGTEEDELIEALRDAAVQAVEDHCHIRLLFQDGLVACFPGFGKGMRVGVGPVSTVLVTRISYIGADGVAVELAEGDWTVGVDGVLYPAARKNWPCGGPVTVTFGAGYAAGECPAPLIAAAKIVLGYLFDMRSLPAEDQGAALPVAVDLLCSRYVQPVI